MSENNYEILDLDSVKNYVVDVMPNFAQNIEELKSSEIGDGNLNLVFKIENESEESIVVKQALPYVRLVGKDWPMTRDRSRIESEAIKVQSQFCSEYVPEVYHMDHEMSLFIMEDLSDHDVYAFTLMDGKENEHVPEIIGEFMAKTLFFTSDLYMDPEEKKEEVKRFTNPELCRIQEELVFTEPLFDVERNEIPDGLDEFLKNDFWKRDNLRKEMAKLKYHYMTHAEALIHGDLHTRSIFVKNSSVKVFDQEFAFYGPMGFDLGLFFGNLMLNFISQEYWGEDEKNTDSMQEHIKEVIVRTWFEFEETFRNLMKQKIEDIHYSINNFEDVFINHLLAESIGYAGAATIRRIHGLAHVPDFWDIKEKNLKLELEKCALNLGSASVLKREELNSIESLTDLMQEYKY